MKNVDWKLVLQFLLIVVVQVLVLNSICLWGYVTPLLYLMFVLTLPFQMPSWLVVSSGFLMGMCVDLFSGVMGVHAASLTFVAFIRPLVMQLIPHAAIEEHQRPILYDMHFPWFAGYTLVMALVHQFLVFFFDALSLACFGHLLVMTLLNALFTTFLILLVQCLFYNSSKRY